MIKSFNIPGGCLGIRVRVETESDNKSALTQETLFILFLGALLKRYKHPSDPEMSDELLKLSSVQITSPDAAERAGYCCSNA